MSRDRHFERWWTDEGKKFFARWGARFTASIAWSNAAYMASGGTKSVEFRTMKKTPPDQPGLWAYRIPGATWSTNVAVARGDSGTLHLHHPNGSTYSVWRWTELYPQTRWKRIS